MKNVRRAFTGDKLSNNFFAPLRIIRGRVTRQPRRFSPLHSLWLLPTVAVFGLGCLCIVMFFAARFRLNLAASEVDNNSVAYQNYAATQSSSSASAALTNNVSAVLGDTTDLDAKLALARQELDDLTSQIRLRNQNLCSLYVLQQIAPYEVYKITTHYHHYSPSLINREIFNITNRLGFDLETISAPCLAQIDNGELTEDDLLADLAALPAANSSSTIYTWLDQENWPIVTVALAKDQATIVEVGEKIDLKPRLIVANLMVEQLRLYTSQRALFKQFFEPLKILSNSTQISLGVMAIKPETARQIENNLRDTTSPYYLGEKYAHLLDYGANENPESERVNRLQSEDNHHYWSYLYGGLYIKQIMKQWENAGFSINDRPEIICTLYNVGFPQSQPKADPKVGGSKVNVNGQDYTFGYLANEWYFSGELLSEYPL